MVKEISIIIAFALLFLALGFILFKLFEAILDKNGYDKEKENRV